MATPATLKRFEVEARGKDFVVRIEDERGRVTELLATRDHLDVIADALDDVLLHDGSDDPDE